MASFAGATQALYVDGVKGSIGSGQNTISDSAGSTTFTINELLDVENSSNTNWFSGDFLGTVVVNGVTLLAIQSGSIIILFGGTEQISSSAFPDNFSSLTLNASDFSFCFLAGTAITTPTGTRAVEDLAVGDSVLTADGRAVPVRWVGVQTVVSVFADPLRNFPIRVAAGALGHNLPVRDLLVSPDHALFLDGVLAQAGALVNGTTIVRETAMPEQFTYYHVELEDHSLILAEGVPAETFLDAVTRRRFDNYADYEARYGEPAPVIAEMDVPRVKSTRQLPAALRRRLAAGAVRSGATVGVAAA